MPPVSKAQHRFMQAAANDPQMRKKLGVSRQVAREFVKAAEMGRGYQSLPAKKGKK
jgi:hypothetical protein